MASMEPIDVGICSDTHGGVLPRWDDRGLVAVLHGGDVYHAPRLPAADDAQLRLWSQSIGAPVLAVRGNHDHHDPSGFFRTARDLSGSIHQLAPGLWVAGIGWAAPLYFDLPGEHEIALQCGGLMRQIRREVGLHDRLLLLTHYPPRLPELPIESVPHEWCYDCVANLVEEVRPIAVVQGHIHEWFGRQWRRDDGTLLVSPGPTGGILSVSADGAVAIVEPNPSPDGDRFDG